jgi:hypothetical protein
MADCRRCKAPIRWVVTEHGKKIPLDREPVPEGNVVAVRLPDGGWVAHVLKKGEAWPDTEHYRPHFVTCAGPPPWA